MKYIANPVEVDAFVITEVRKSEGVTGGYFLTLTEGLKEWAYPEMTSRTIPSVGDYWVVQSDGYTYLNPKAVFERKYRPA